jgi:hypothetical protein
MGLVLRAVRSRTELGTEGGLGMKYGSPALEGHFPRRRIELASGMLMVALAVSPGIGPRRSHSRASRRQPTSFAPTAPAAEGCVSP